MSRFLLDREIGVCVGKLAFLVTKYVRCRHCSSMLKSMKNQSLNKCTLSNLVLTLGEETFASRIPGRTSPEPSKKGSAFNLGRRTVKKNNMLLVAIVKCISGKKPSKMEMFS